MKEILKKKKKSWYISSRKQDTKNIYNLYDVQLFNKC
jgi:hypothetical protein